MCIQGFSENLTTALKESPHAEKESESSSQKVVKLHIYFYKQLSFCFSKESHTGRILK